MITPAADADVAEIITFLAGKAGVGVALRYSAAFEDLFDHLAMFPDSGSRRSRLGANIRASVFSPYIILYRHTEVDSTVRVLRIVHAKRRITGKMLRGAL